MDDTGRITHRYRRDLTWDPIVVEHADKAKAL